MSDTNPTQIHATGEATGFILAPDPRPEHAEFESAHAITR